MYEEIKSKKHLAELILKGSTWLKAAPLDILERKLCSLLK